MLRIVCAILLTISLTYGLNSKIFPKNFKFGTSTSAYQVEGAWNEDGKTPSIWDNFAHAGKLANNDTGDVACDSYHKYKEDVQMLKYLGVDHYRFSLSWSRILPTGFVNQVNKPGVQYYKKLIQELVDNGIEPLVTMYHWDLPQTLQDLGGWANPIMADYFADYASKVFELFGDKVKIWLTFNEPELNCQLSYSGVLAPGYKSSGVGDYLCMHTILKAHAKAYHIYDKEFRQKQKGKISLSMDGDWFEPASNSTEDLKASETTLQFIFGWIAHPIVHGNYPKVMIKQISERSEKEGFPRSRLPEFTPEEIKYIKGTYDFLGLNTYNTVYVKGQNNKEPLTQTSWAIDKGTSTSADLSLTPFSGTRKLLKWIKDEYKNPEIFITENGVRTDGGYDDDVRINYHTGYFNSILQAIYLDRVKVTGYTIWTLMDDLEWIRGYTSKMGIYKVDFDSPNRTRTPRKSADFFKKIFATHCLDEECK